MKLRTLIERKDSPDHSPANMRRAGEKFLIVMVEQPNGSFSISAITDVPGTISDSDFERLVELSFEGEIDGIVDRSWPAVYGIEPIELGSDSDDDHGEGYDSIEDIWPDLGDGEEPYVDEGEWEWLLYMYHEGFAYLYAFTWKEFVAEIKEEYGSGDDFDE